MWHFLLFVFYQFYCQSVIQNTRMEYSQIKSLIAGFIVMLINGSIYVYGAMTPYLATFLFYTGNIKLKKENKT